MPELGFYASQAELYDLAFSWDVEDEVVWLLERFGAGTKSVLEPFCGNGRLFPGFGRRGVATAGVDLSPEMLAKSAARMAAAGLAAPILAEADTREFDLGRRFDAAFCPVNSFGYLHTEDDLVRHLTCVARHLPPGGRYLVQQGLRNVTNFRPLVVDTTSQWDEETPRGRLRTTWKSGPFDAMRLIETQISHFEWVTGPNAGQAAEFAHAIRIWSWDAWSRAIAKSPFREVAAWDGDVVGRPPLPVGPVIEGRLLAWHELELAAPSG